MIVSKNNHKFNINYIFIVFLTVLMLLPSVSVNTSAKGNAIAQKALSRVGSRYQRGAAHSLASVKNKNQRRFDCSGLVNWSCYQAGHKIGIRTSSSLRRVGHSVSKKNMKAGDIVLFAHHAGIYVGHGKMVHAPGTGRRVTVVKMSGYWSRRLQSVRRV